MTDHRITADNFAAALADKFPEDTFEVDPAGRKYLRIVQEDKEHGGRHVHAFVDAATGALLMARGWKAPAKDPRYDLSTPEGFAHAVEQADQFTGYLYKKR